jgi:hypothetical protein
MTGIQVKTSNGVYSTKKAYIISDDIDYDGDGIVE